MSKFPLIDLTDNELTVINSMISTSGQFLDIDECIEAALDEEGYTLYHVGDLIECTGFSREKVAGVLSSLDRKMVIDTDEKLLSPLCLAKGSLEEIATYC